ncbi:MAG: flagellar hook-associated protein FlgL [Oligoflexia bacterium]|nr:flagellar hook-associated protein FlgL [Oligoflexia bacterium]
MRVTENTNYGVVRDSIRRTKERMEELQTQSSTMRKLNSPSDDPVGAAKVLEVRTDKVNNDQFITNAKLAEAFLNNTDHALSEIADIVVRCKELAINQASGASATPETRVSVAEEVTQLYQQAVAAANRRIGERYLFGGYKTQTPPVDKNGRYHGDDGQTMVEIAKGIFLGINIPGAEAFNTNLRRASDNSVENSANRAPAGATEEDRESPNRGPENINVFDEIQNLRIGLLTGDLNTIRGTLDNFDQIHGKLLSTRAKIGSRINGLESTGQALERHNLTNAQLTQNIEDADMAQVVSDMAKEETVLRSALQSSHKLLQPTLMDFLK